MSFLYNKGKRLSGLMGPVMDKIHDPSRPGSFPGFSPVGNFMGPYGFGGYGAPTGFSPAVSRQGFGIPSFGFGMPDVYGGFNNPYGGFHNFPRPQSGGSRFQLPFPMRNTFNFGPSLPFLGGFQGSSMTGIPGSQFRQGTSSFLPSFMQNYSRPFAIQGLRNTASKPGGSAQTFGFGRSRPRPINRPIAGTNYVRK